MGFRKVRRMREDAIHSRSGPWKNVQCCETADVKSGNESDPERRKSRQELWRATRARKQASFHHRVAGRRREWKEAPSKRIWVRELKTVSKSVEGCWGVGWN